jgi:tetratricopeptide (TPR) repeat protein
MHFVRVCQTIGYAHAEGVLHRDLSPRNVMLIGTEETFVIDWGLATEDAATPLPPGAAATRAGVAAFMAPEIWDDDHPGRHTAASDIYSLGALLYLILTNHPPCEGSVPEVLAQMAAGPPPAVESRWPDVPRPLRFVCARALQRRPELRYPTADELGRDVERWLTGDLVSVDRMPWRERAWRWCGRHRTFVTTAAAVVLLSSLGMLAAYLGMRAAYGREVELRQEADSHRAAADRQRDRADTAIRKIIDQLESVGKVQATLPGMRALLEDAARYCEELATQATDVAEDRAHVAEEYARVGKIVFKFNEIDRAAEVLEKARALAEPLAREYPEDASHQNRLAVCLHYGGVMQVFKGDTAKAEQTWLQARDVLRPVAAASAQYRETLAKLYMVLGNVHGQTGRFAQMEEDFREAQTLGEAIVKEEPANQVYRFTLAEIRSNQGNFLAVEAVPDGKIVKAPAKLREAEDAIRASLLLRRELFQAQPDNPEYRVYVAVSLNLLGEVLQHQGEARFIEAEKYFREALELYEILTVAFPGVPSHRQEIAQVYSNLGELMRKQQRSDEALSWSRRAVDHFARLQRTYPNIPDHAQELGVAREVLAEALAATGRREEAGQACYQAAVAFALAAGLQRDAAKRQPPLTKALELLEWAKQADYFTKVENVRRLRDEPAFAALQAEDGFQKLRDEVGRE